MADLVTSQTLLDGERLAIMKFTDISDGTGENKVVKVQVSTLSPSASGRPCTGVTINKIYSTTHGLEVQIFFEATSATFAWAVPQNSQYKMDFSSFGGLTNNAGAGKNGNISFSTADASAGDFYVVMLELVKSYA